MNHYFDFLKISQYNKYVININQKDYEKILECVNKLKEKYNNELLSLYNLEKQNSKQFNFDNQKQFIIKHKKVLLEIINDVLNTYANELENLSVVFLSGSFARGTNKMSSDIDLHFFYKDNNYNYVFEEIVCYIISRVINKSRDSIDPTFIFNIQIKNKSMITSKMDKNKLSIILKYKKNEIKYSYKYGKKRRFYLQYTNTRDINELFNYLSDELINCNEEWCHCFEIIKGKEAFDNLYDKVYLKELMFINNSYINKKINLLINNIKKDKKNITNSFISEYKNYYQSTIFKYIYEYISIIRFILIKEKNTVKYLNLIDIYNLLQTKNEINKDIFIEIYKYMWNLEKLSLYCYENNINYGLHNNTVINYSTKELDEDLKVLKQNILKDLERLSKLYE